MLKSFDFAKFPDHFHRIIAGLFFYSNRYCNPEIVIMADSADQLQ